MLKKLTLIILLVSILSNPKVILSNIVLYVPILFLPITLVLYFISPQKIIDKVQKIFETVDAVYKEIDSKMSGTNWGDNEETIKKVCDELNTLNKSVGGLSSIDDKNVSNTKTR